MTWEDLARYNTEVSHGVVHAPEYDKRMAEQQRLFNANCPSCGLPLPTRPDPGRTEKKGMPPPEPHVCHLRRKRRWWRR